MESISAPASLGVLFVRLVVAAILGGAVGVNRELLQKPAGLRTHALVSLGAALAALVGVALMQPGSGDVSAASRVIQGIVAGIGFVGGGVILHRDDPRGAHGLTTAASIWVVAAAGVAAGVGMWRSGAMTIALTLAVLTLGGPIDRRLRQMRSVRDDLD